jgi:hypothetical protein
MTAYTVPVPLPRIPPAVLPARRYRISQLASVPLLLCLALAAGAQAQPEPPGEDPARNTLLVIGLGLSLIALVIVTLWIAWPLLHRATEGDPC